MSDARRLLAAFVRGDISVSALLDSLRDYLVISGTPNGSMEVTYSGTPLPHVTFTRDDVARMLDRAIASDLSIEQLSEWANLITLLDCFDLSAAASAAADEVWDVLDRMAHPELTGVEEPWKLRELRGALA